MVRLAGWLARSDDAVGPEPARRSDKAKRTSRRVSARVARSLTGQALSKALRRDIGLAFQVVISGQLPFLGLCHPADGSTEQLPQAFQVEHAHLRIETLRILRGEHQ